tara:strand:- start:1007 stop:1261 length:255 start_codon:yes stop_codon:yes gene_type:complete
MFEFTPIISTKKPIMYIKLIVLKRLAEKLEFAQRNKNSTVNKFTGVNDKTISLNGSKNNKVEPNILKKNINKQAMSILFLSMWF